MTEPNKKYIIDAKGKKTGIILDLKTYGQLLDEIDELNCALGFDQAKKENLKDLSTGNAITLEEFFLKQKNKKQKTKIHI